jgi:hypothetical protein
MTPILFGLAEGGGEVPGPSAKATETNDISKNVTVKIFFMFSPVNRGIPQANSVVGYASRRGCRRKKGAR